MSTGFGSRSLGMGGAAVAIVNDVTSTFWNPAALAKLKNSEISFMHDERFSSLVNYDYVGGGIPFEKNSESGNVIIDDEGNVLQEMNYNASTFAISLTRLGVDGIPDTRNSWADSNSNGIFDEFSRPEIDKITYFNAADWVLYLSFAKQYNEKIFWGANVKLIRRSMSDINATGIGIDFGALYDFNENFSVGLTANDISTTLLFYSTGRNEVIMPTIKIGSAYQINFWRGIFSLVNDFEFKFEGKTESSFADLNFTTMTPRIGFEYDFEKLVAIRAGVNENKNLTLGAGIHLRKMDLDYSFAKFNASDELGNSHRISIKIKIED